MSIAQHYPVLHVVLPLIAAPVMVLARHGGFAWLLATAVSWTSLAISAALLAQVHDGGVISYAIGSWAPPWGIEYRIDSANAYLLVLVSLIGSVAVIYGRTSIEAEVPREQHYLFYSMYSLCLAGLLGIAATGDGFNLFVFLEISSLSSYVLIALGRDRRALMASYQYLIMGTIGATFIVIGVGLLFLMTGTLNLVDIADRLPGVVDKRPVLAALAFITVGVSLKLALFPLHFWLPNAYAYAPSAVTALLAATATKVGAYILLRFLFTIFGIEISFATLQADGVILLAAAVAVIVGSLNAIRQTDVKRMLAYSSVAQVGYIALGFGLVSVTGLSAGILHLFNHALMKGALFLALGSIVYRLGSTELRDLHGLARHMPWTFAAFTAGGLSLVGIPLTAGFISKWYLLQATIEQGWWSLAVVVVVGSLLAVLYVWRVVEVAYFQPRPSSARKVREAPLALLVPTWILVLANIYFGIDTTLSVGTATNAARALLTAAGGAP